MPFSLTTKPQDGYLLVESAGSIDSDSEAIDLYFTPQVERTIETGVKRLLVDERALAINLDYHDVVEIAEDWSRQALQSQGVRIAVIHAGESTEKHEAYETAAFNRSIAYRTFPNRAQALGWLLDA